MDADLNERDWGAKLQSLNSDDMINKLNDDGPYSGDQNAMPSHHPSLANVDSGRPHVT